MLRTQGIALLFAVAMALPAAAEALLLHRPRPRHYRAQFRSPPVPTSSVPMAYDTFKPLLRISTEA